MRRTIIIDTDPGHDDAVAILFALGASEHLDVKGLTCVAGNVSLDLTSRNARIVRDWANCADLPVYAGCPRPILRDQVTAEHVHGKSGMDGVKLHEPAGPLASGHAVNFLIETLKPDAGVTLCAIGPLTNLATALVMTPNIRRGIAEIVLMAGTHFNGGNMTPVAEFNIFADPHAADIVFRSGIPITVVPLDVTYKALTTPARIAALRSVGNGAGRVAADLITSHDRFETQKFGLQGGPLHDPCVIAYLLNRSLFAGRYVNVSVQTQRELTYGMTVVDWNDVTDRPKNVNWLYDIDSDGFYALLTEMIGRLP